MPKLRYFQLFTRMKQIHCISVLLLLGPVTHLYIKGEMQWKDWSAFVGVSGALLIMLIIASVYVRRVIGRISYHSDTGMLQITTLDFWGQRLDVMHSSDRVVPWSDVRRRYSRKPSPVAFQTLQIRDRKTPYYYNLAMGEVKNLSLLAYHLWLPEELGGSNDRAWQSSYDSASRHAGKPKWSHRPLHEVAYTHDVFRKRALRLPYLTLAWICIATHTIGLCLLHQLRVTEFYCWCWTISFFFFADAYGYNRSNFMASFGYYAIVSSSMYKFTDLQRDSSFA